MMEDDKPLKLLKCRVIRADGSEQSLAWNVDDYEHDAVRGYLHLHHSRGEVIHYFAPGDTVQMLEQYGGEDD